MQSNNTSASVQALLRYKMGSGSGEPSFRAPPTITSAYSNIEELGVHPVGVPPMEISTSNTINSKINFKELYKLRKSIMYCFAIALSGFIFGLDIGIIGGLVNFPSFRIKFGNANGNFDRITLGVIVGISSISACVSGLASHYLTNEFGRKLSVIGAMLLYAIGLVIIMGSDNVYELILGRVFNGFGIGLSSVAAPMLISELPQLKLRGSMVSSMQLMTTLGIFTGSITLYLARSLRGSNQYLVPIYVSLLFTILTSLVLSFVPESPIFLVKSQLDENAAEIIAELNNLQRDHWYVIDWITKLQKNFNKHKEHENSVSILQAEPKILRRVMIGVEMMIFQQFSGINYFFFYGTSIFQNANIDDPYLTSIILASVNLITSMVSITVSDRFGRRNMLIIGSVCMFTCMMIFASIGTFALDDVASGPIMICVTCIFIMAFSMTWGPISFLVVGELFPYNYKAKGMAFASSANWITTFIISFCTPFITQKIGFQYGFFFALCLFTSVIFVWGYVPETRKRESEAIDAIYALNNKTFWKGTTQYESGLVEQQPVQQQVVSPEVAVEEKQSPELEYEMVQLDTNTTNNNPFI